MVSVTDVADRAPKVMQADEFVDIGDRSLRWLETPHLPHGWDCGMILDERSRTLFCSDLFTQGGAGETALTENDILESSEAFRALDDYYAHAPNTVEQLEHLAATAPRTLACMHGSAWRGDGASLLKQLAKRLAR
jgi:flavorubredoxin